MNTVFFELSEKKKAFEFFEHCKQICTEEAYIEVAEDDWGEKKFKVSWD